MGPQLALTIGLTMLSVAGCVHHLTSAQLVARECALSPAESAQRPVEQFEAFLAPVIITDINGPNRMWLDLREANVCRLSHALALPGVASDKRAEVIVAVLQSKEAQLLTKACQEHFGTVLESSAMAAAAPSCAMWQKARVIAAQALAADQRLIETATVQRWLTTRLTTSLKTDVDGWLRRQVNDAEVLAAAVPAAELFVTRLVSGTIEERLLAQRMFDTWSTDFSRLKNALVNDSDTAEVLLMRFRLLVAIPEANEHADIICANSPPPRHGEVLGYLMRSKLCECRPPSLDLSKECIASDAREPASLKSKFRLALEGELAQDHRVAAVFPYLYSEADQLKPASMTALEAWGAYVSLAALATHRNDDIAISAISALARLSSAIVNDIPLLHPPDGALVTHWLIELADREAHTVAGSESATLHGIKLHALAGLLNTLTKVDVVMREGQDINGMRTGIERWRAAAHGIASQTP